VLFELLTKFNNRKCPAYLKQFGILDEIIAIKYRAKRCQQAWSLHLSECKSFIKNQVNKDANKYGSRQIVILGAGLLLDLDLKYLSNVYDEVILIDAYFLNETKANIQKLVNVKYLELDLTRCLYKVLKLSAEEHLSADFSEYLAQIDKIIASSKQKSMSKRHPMYRLIDSTNVCTMVSLNVFSQLPHSFENHFKDLFGKLYREEDFVNFYRFILKDHLNYLCAAAEKNIDTYLVTDTIKQVTNVKSEKSYEKSSIWDIKLSQSYGGMHRLANWTWLLAPKPELDRQHDLSLKVEALHIPAK
jgi:hypothetical protein